MSTQGSISEPVAEAPNKEAPNKSKTFPSLLAGIGASGAVLAAAATGFVFLVGAVSFDVWPQARPALGGATGELSAPATTPQAPVVAPVAGLAPAVIASSPALPVLPVGGSGVTTAPNSVAPKLGNAGLDAGAAPSPSPGVPAPGEGDTGSPGGGNGGGSGIAGEDDEPPVDVSRPIYEPADPSGTEPGVDAGSDAEQAQGRPIRSRGRGRRGASPPSIEADRWDDGGTSDGGRGGDGDGDTESRHGDRGQSSGRGHG